MMHNGRFPDGGLVYPAMPFASYTKVTREDSDAIFAYLRSIPPVKQPNTPHDLSFPYNNRSLILGWRTLFFKEGEYKPDPTKSADWNRGAYLVEGLGHCGMCHTAINALGGSSESQAFEGGLIPMQNWYAPSLTSNKEAGLGDWSIEEISDLLRTGISNRGAVYGPMAEVVYNSLQYLNDDDTRAMAVYLKSLAARHARRIGRRRRCRRPKAACCCRLGKPIYDRRMRRLPRRQRPRRAAALSAAGRQPVDPDGVGGQRRSAWCSTAAIRPGTAGNPDALRHAAVRAAAVRRRGRRGRDLYPHRPGAIAASRSRRGRPTNCARQR